MAQNISTAWLPVPHCFISCYIKETCLALLRHGKTLPCARSSFYPEYKTVYLILISHTAPVASFFIVEESFSLIKTKRPSLTRDHLCSTPTTPYLFRITRITTLSLSPSTNFYPGRQLAHSRHYKRPARDRRTERAASVPDTNKESRE